MKQVRIGLIGSGFMGKSHAVAFRNVPLVFAPSAEPVLELLADLDEAAARKAAGALGFRRSTGDWRALVEDPDVDVVDITTPNFLHKEMALAAIEAGKHVYCEKPLALTTADARAMTEAAEAAGIKTLVGFNYLKNPATGLVKRIVGEGTLGDVVHFRGTFNQDALADPMQPFSWRFRRDLAGSGALGDLASHTINLAQYLIGEIEEVCAQTQTRITRRPVIESGAGYQAKAAAGAEMREVENEDQVQALLRFANGAAGTIESSRIASGRKLGLTYEVTGTKGAVSFTQERMNEVKLYRADDPAAEQGFRTILIGPDHPPYGDFHPIAGIGLGYNDQKIIEAYELIEGIAADRPLYPDFRAGLETCRVIDAVLRSADQRRWIAVADI
jgi:predicted dehydrogenase